MSTPLPTATPLATASPSPGTTPIPFALQQQAALQFVQARYVSGANPLAESQTTRVTIEYSLRNPLSVPLNYTGTAVIDTATGVTPVSATATRGTTAITGTRVTWDGFVLGPGESASTSVTADITPAPGSAGTSVVVIAGTLTTARTVTGGLVDVRGGPVDSTAIMGMTNSGLVVARAPGTPPVAPAAAGAGPAPGAGPAAGAGPTAGVAPASGTVGVGGPAPAAASAGTTSAGAPTTAAQPRPAPATQAQTPVTGLARTGTGLDADSRLDGSVAVGGLALLAVAMAASATLARRRARRD